MEAFPYISKRFALERFLGLSEEEIKKEYVDLCTRAGELQYQLEQMKAELQALKG